MKEIPFLNLNKQYLSIKEEIDSAISSVIDQSAFIRGHYVDKFEKDFQEVLGVKNSISCGNGTDSLYISMKALGVTAGDEVIVPAHSWISTSETVSQLGAEPIFCDTDDSYTIDPKKIESLISDRTKGIIPVHLYGHPADMDPISSIAKDHNLWIIEDCAQAHLAKYKNKYVGTIGNTGSFSFYPGKNLGAMGDAGAIITNDNELTKKMTMFARHGGTTKGEHIIEGINSRMDGIQAAILSVKLKYLQQWTKSRQKVAKSYLNKLEGIDGIVLPNINSNVEHVWHLFVIRLKNRDLVKTKLAERGVQTGIHYPICLPLLKAYSRKNHSPNEFPIAYRNQGEILSLPLFPEMQEDEIDYVVENLIESIEN